MPLPLWKKALRRGRSAEQWRSHTVVPARYVWVGTSQTNTSCGASVKSSPFTTFSVSRSIVQRDTKAPLEPCPRAMPLVAVISWFMISVKCRDGSPVNAPRPSGMPTIL